MLRTFGLLHGKFILKVNFFFYNMKAHYKTAKRVIKIPNLTDLLAMILTKRNILLKIRE